MKRHTVRNNPKTKARIYAKEYSPQEIIRILLKEIECESVSMFVIKDEHEFLSVLGLVEEVFHV